MEIPRGVEDLAVNTTCDVDAAMQLVEAGSGNEFMNYQDSRVNYMETLRIAGSAPVALNLNVQNYAGQEDTAVLSFRYRGISNCSGQNLGCDLYDQEKAELEVLHWSCWVREWYPDAAGAWAALGGSQILEVTDSIPWHRFQPTWAKWPQRADNHSWQYAFHRLDLDQNQQVSRSEFSAGLQLCTPSTTTELPSSYDGDEYGARPGVAGTDGASMASSGRLAGKGAEAGRETSSGVTMTQDELARTHADLGTEGRLPATAPVPLRATTITTTVTATTTTTRVGHQNIAGTHSAKLLSRVNSLSWPSGSGWGDVFSPITAVLAGMLLAALGLLAWTWCCARPRSRHKQSYRYRGLPNFDSEEDDLEDSSTSRSDATVTPVQSFREARESKVRFSDQMPRLQEETPSSVWEEPCCRRVPKVRTVMATVPKVVMRPMTGMVYPSQVVMPPALGYPMLK